MLVEDLIKLAAGEPERTVTQTIRTVPPLLLAKARQPGGLGVLELMSTPGLPSERRAVTYRHILGPPASREALEAWDRRMPLRPLPADLRALLLRVNGIHLWAESRTGRAYVGLAPVEEWDIARITMYGAAARQGLLDDRYIAISYDEGGGAYIVLDPTTGTYFLMDTAGPAPTTPIAHDVGELLDYLWRTRNLPIGES
ncbi:MAG: SMI1/KNR4 family protein [Polyangiaceae bacterium]